MGQYRRFKPVSVTTFPVKKNKKSKTKLQRLNRVVYWVTLFVQYTTTKAGLLESGKILSVDSTTSEAMQHLTNQ